MSTEKRTMRARSWIRLYIFAFVMAFGALALFSGLRGYTTDDAAVVIALPFTMYLILTHLIEVVVPKTTEKDKRALTDYMRRRPPSYRFTVWTLAVTFVAGVMFAAIATSLAFSAWAYKGLGISEVSKPVQGFALSLLVVAAVLCAIPLLTVYLLPALFHVGRTVRKIVFEMVAIQIRGGVWSRGSVA